MTTISATTQPSAFVVFKRRSFTLMWIADFISTIGSALTSLAASILIFRITGSALSVGLMLMATALPSLVVGLIAGVFVDRYDRRRIMIAANVTQAALVFLIPFLVPFNIVWLYVIVMLSSAVGQFFDPAHESVLPEIASDEELAAANSLIAISSFGSTAIGFAASGLIASQFPIEWAFYIDAITFIISAGCIYFIRVASLENQEETNVRTVIRNLRAGARFLFDSSILRSLFLVSAPVMASFGLWNSLLLPFAIRALNASEFEYGLQEGLTSVGFVLGSLLMARLADRIREGQWITLSFIGMGIIGALYAMSTTIPLAIALVMISGFLNAPSAIGRRLVIQRNTTREVRGRVNSAFFVSRDIIFLLGMAAAGLADLIDVRMMVLGSSVLLAAAGVLTFFLPGLGQPAAEWRRAVRLLRAAPSAPGLGVGRLPTLADLDRIVMHVPALSRMSEADRKSLMASGTVSEAAPGTVILRKGDLSNETYFILEGKAIAGRQEEDDYRPLEVLNSGDFFGEIAALTGVPRTANVIAEEPTTLLQIPATTLRNIMDDAQINRLFLSKMTERMVRMNMIDMPRYVGLDQQMLKELRTPAPAAGIATG
jgi:DHA3 family macrolide efflux protein-like MFS transporter